MISTNSHTNLADSDVKLREITLNDTDFVVRLRNTPEILKWFTSQSKVSKEGHEKFMQRYFKSDNTDEIYIIEYQNIPVGMISLYDIAHGQAEWGRVAVDPVYQKKGIGKKALKLIIERAKTLGLVRVYCSVRKENSIAISFYKSFGFMNWKELESSQFLELSID